MDFDSTLHPDELLCSTRHLAHGSLNSGASRGPAWGTGRLIGMRNNRQKRQITLIGSVTPDQAVGARRVVLRVRLKDLLSRVIRVAHRIKLMCVQTWMPRILKQQCYGFMDLLEDAFLFA